MKVAEVHREANMYVIARRVSFCTQSMATAGPIALQYCMISSTRNTKPDQPRRSDNRVDITTEAVRKCWQWTGLNAEEHVTLWILSAY
jgi:hypothetical protein